MFIKANRVLQLHIPKAYTHKVATLAIKKQGATEFLNKLKSWSPLKVYSKYIVLNIRNIHVLVN